MGDGIYKWYFGGGSCPEMYMAEESRESAIAAGWSSYPEGDFTVVEADKAKPTCDVFAADWIIERYEECNEECWGEDGADIATTIAQERELEKQLGETLRAWMDKHDLHGRVWSFGNTRNEEYFPLKAEEAADAVSRSTEPK